MKLINTVKLVRKQKDRIVHCDIELCPAPGASDRYLVNLRQGRIGEEWRDSTRTPQPVGLPEATRLFDQAVAAKLAQGFGDDDSATAAGDAGAATATAVHEQQAPTAADRAILQRLERGSWQSLTPQQRKRTVWRIGERRLRAAVPVLVDQIERGETMLDYCIAWAIGRCGDRGAMEAMRELHGRSPEEAVRRVALQAWLMLAEDGERHEHARRLIAAWPDAVRSAWANADQPALLTVATQGAGWHGLDAGAWLEQLDQVAQDAAHAPLARPLLLEALRRIPLRDSAFATVRHIYKMAEMRADAVLFALLQRRFESTPHRDGWVQVGRNYRPAAYGRVTRNYLLQRGWRMLRRLGAAADPDFVPLALAALAEYDDANAGKPYRRNERQVGPYGHWPLFNHLLRSHAGLRSSSTGLTWYDAAPASDAGRHEAFPALWDGRPDALLWLLLHSRCEGVHAFAARALADNTPWCAGLSPATLRDLLRSPYIVTARFAFDLARRRFEPERPDPSWLMLFIESGLAEAVQYALDWTARDIDFYAAHADLVATMLFAQAQPVRRQAWLLCQAAMAQPGLGEVIVQSVLDWLDDSVGDDADRVGNIAADLLRALELPLRAAAAHAPYGRLAHLLQHRLAAVRALVCHWMLLHAQPVSMVPPAALAALLRDDASEVRAMGVRLFGALPDHVLAQQADLVASFACAPEQEVRRAIAPLIARLSATDPGFGAALLPALLDGLFRGETGTGLHADLLAWIAGPLAALDALDDADLLRRLLAARSKGAQLLGAALVERFDPARFEVSDWAAFGRNQNIAVREWSYAAFRAHPERARTQLEAALRLFDGKFDDTRAFATAYFSDAGFAADWTPLLLVSLCDHPEPAAQRFGRAMITAHLDVAEVADLMLKLSQHPSVNMQLFVSAWLEATCGGDVAKLRRLEPYFLAVLSQVDRGRATRNRVQAFLREQAMLSDDIGAFVAQLFARQVVTTAIGDKAYYIESLRAIQARYPQLPAVLTVQLPPTLPVRMQP